MDKIGIACFTGRGAFLADRLGAAFSDTYEVMRYERDLKAWCASCFEKAKAMIFIGACGIAVRTIAPFLKSKTTDPAVLVIDEAGHYVISLLSGHLGGANELAADVAELIGAVPVITTASDVNGLMAVDVFAKKNGLVISSMKDAKKTAAALLDKKRVGVYCTGTVEGNVPQELTLVRAGEQGMEPFDCMIWIAEHVPVAEEISQYMKPAFGQGQSVKNTELVSGQRECVQNVVSASEQKQSAQSVQCQNGTLLHLIPKNTVLGIGCRKGKTEAEISAVVCKVLEESGIPEAALAAVASIDVKKDEPGILEFCKNRGLEYVTWTAKELEAAPGDFEVSDFVKKTVGVDNVCERAAILASGKNGRLLHKKYARDGVTAALAVKEWRVSFGK